MKKFQNYPELIKLVKSLAVDDNAKPQKFLNYINKLDAIRGNNFYSLCSEWSELLV